jgi:hypothetical protein
VRLRFGFPEVPSDAEEGLTLLHSIVYTRLGATPVRFVRIAPPADPPEFVEKPRPTQSEFNPATMPSIAEVEFKARVRGERLAVPPPVGFVDPNQIYPLEQTPTSL